MESPKGTKRFSDFTIVTVCRYENFNEPTEPIFIDGKSWFTFEDTPRLNQVISDYFSGKCLVNPSRFAHLLREVRREAALAKQNAEKGGEK